MTSALAPGSLPRAELRLHLFRPSSKLHFLLSSSRKGENVSGADKCWALGPGDRGKIKSLDFHQMVAGLLFFLLLFSAENTDVASRI